MKNKFNLFSKFTAKSVTKDDEFAQIPTNFKGFFVMFGRKFWNISNLSLLYSFINLPVIFFLLGYSLRQPVTVASNAMTSHFFGFWQISQSQNLAFMFPFLSGFDTAYVSSTASYICYAVGALFVLTFGLSNAGAAYCIRGYNRGDPVFLISDFFSTIKKNLRQSLVIGVLDILISAVLIYDFLFWNSSAANGFMSGVFMYFALFICVLYFFMRFYIYTIMITFDLSIYKIFKDAFLLSFLGFKRNFLALFGIILLVALNVQIFIWLPPVGVMLPIILTLAAGMFITGYASYPVIKKYMIDPYYSDENTVSDEEDEPVFEDRG